MNIFSVQFIDLKTFMLPKNNRFLECINVIVHRLITTGTFEERIDEMIKSKKELANLTVASGENWITEMDNKQIMNLVSLN